MAQRRMFSLRVVDTDAFCEMPSSAQNLYFQIGMRADDEGFFAGVMGLMAKIHSGQDDLRVLLARGFILDRGDGVYVVKHWKMNNYLQKDRIQPTEYAEKKVGLYEKEDRSYTLSKEKSALYTECIHSSSVVQCSAVKGSVDISTEDGIGKERSLSEMTDEEADKAVDEAVELAKREWGLKNENQGT